MEEKDEAIAKKGEKRRVEQDDKVKEVMRSCLRTTHSAGHGSRFSPTIFLDGKSVRVAATFLSFPTMVYKFLLPQSHFSH